MSYNLLLINLINCTPSRRQEGGYDVRCSCKVRRKGAIWAVRAGWVLPNVLKRGDRYISTFGPLAGPLNDLNLPRPSLISQLRGTSGSITISPSTACKKDQNHLQPTKKGGNASQFNDIDSFFCQGYSEAGAPSWLWEWIFDDWPSCSDASSAHARSVPEQGLLWLPPRAVRLWDAGEAGYSKLSSRRGDNWTGWDDKHGLIMASLVTFIYSWWLFMWT